MPRDVVLFLFLFFFFNDTATTEIYTLSLHDALPICDGLHIRRYLIAVPDGGRYEYPFLTSWPDYKPDPNTAYGYEDVKVTPPIPSPAAIRRMEEVLVWLQLAPVEYRRLLWFRAEGVVVAQVRAALWLWWASGQAALAEIGRAHV